jgi:excisionase family DNA binding protein
MFDERSPSEPGISASRESCRYRFCIYFEYCDYFDYLLDFDYVEENKMLGATVTMPPSEAEQVQELYRILQLGTPALVGPNGERLELPESVYHLLKDVVRNMRAGRAITLLPEKQQLTTQSAANLLGFSRPHLIKLLEAGTIPFQKVGQHRRILLRDVIAFQKQRDADRRTALDKLARDEFDAGTYTGTGIPEGGSDE